MNDLQTSEEEFRQNSLNYIKQFLYSGPLIDPPKIFNYNGGKFAFEDVEHIYADLLPQKKELGEQIEELIQKLENVNKI